MEEEKTKNNATNNEKNNKSDTASLSSKNNDKYKSKKNSSKKANSNNPKSNDQTKNTLGKKIRQNLTNAAFNKAANTIPGLGAVNNFNNIRKLLGARKSILSKKSPTGISESEDNSATNAENVTKGEESNVANEDNATSLNPLDSIIKSKSSLLGIFDFWGRISLPIKLTIFIGTGLFLFILLFLILAIPLGAHSSLLEFNSGTTSSGSGKIDYGDYVLSSDGHEILHQSLDSFLQTKGTSIEEFNNLISSNVNSAGYKTREGVVTAAVTLIAELGNKYSVKIPYFWGGGHGNVATGAEANWGSGACRTYANGVFYNYCGLDCSGFVTWAIKNGGFTISPLGAGQFKNLPGAQRVSLTDSAILQPGDILESNSHVVLVVAVEDDKYVCAEASGNMTGVLFTRRNFNISGYWGVKMDGYYG